MQEGHDISRTDAYFLKYASLSSPITPGQEVTGVIHK